MESKPTWNDVMQYTNCSFDSIVGEYWIRAMYNRCVLNVHLDKTEVMLRDLSFSWCWSRDLVESLHPEIVLDTGFDRIQQLEISGKPVPLKAETLLTILRAISYLGPNMFDGSLPFFLLMERYRWWAETR